MGTKGVTAEIHKPEAVTTPERLLRQQYACTSMGTTVRMRLSENAVRMHPFQKITTREPIWEQHYACASIENAFCMRHFKKNTTHAPVWRQYYACVTLQKIVHMRQSDNEVRMCLTEVSIVHAPVLIPNNACAILRVAVRMRQYRVFTMHASFCRQHYACVCQNSICQSRWRTTHAPVWDLQYACANLENALRMRQFENSNTHAPTYKMHYACASLETALRMHQC